MITNQHKPSDIVYLNWSESVIINGVDQAFFLKMKEPILYYILFSFSNLMKHDKQTSSNENYTFFELPFMSQTFWVKVPNEIVNNDKDYNIMNELFLVWIKLNVSLA